MAEIKGKERISFGIQQASYVRPKVNETKLDGGFHTYGEDNNYPDWLLNIYFGSSQHQGIIQRKVDEILGEGLTTELAPLKALLISCNRRGQGLNDVFRKCVNDNLIIGGFCVQIIYGKGSTKEHPIITDLFYVDISKFRWNKTYDRLLYSKDWNKGTNHKVIKYKTYDPNDPTGTRIFYYGGTMTRDWYPVPEYVGSIPSIETAIDIANYNQNTLRNGFFPSIHATFFDGEPTEEEKGNMEKAMQEKWGGTNNTGRFVLSFADNKDKAPTFTAIAQPDLDTRFAALKESVVQDIFIGHRITDPSLFGLAVAGKLGNSDYTQSYAIFQNVYVRPARKVLMALFNAIVQGYLPTNVEADLDVLEVEPINNVFKDEGLIASQMTRNEFRTCLKKWGYVETVEVAPGEYTIAETPVGPEPGASAEPGDPAVPGAAPGAGGAAPVKPVGEITIRKPAIRI